LSHRADFWFISRLRNFTEENFIKYLYVLREFDGKTYNRACRIAIMHRMVECGVTQVKNLWSIGTAQREVLLDKRWQSHVSWMLCLGIAGFPKRGEPLQLTPIARQVLRDNNITKFMLQQMLRWQLPNGNMKSGDILNLIARKKGVQPFIMLLEALKHLKDDYEGQQDYLTREEIVGILMPLRNHTELPDALQEIVKNRARGYSYRNLSPTAFNYLEIILSFFTATGIVEQILSRNLVMIRIKDKLHRVVDAILANAPVFFKLTAKEKEKWFEYYGSPEPLPAEIIRELFRPRRRVSTAKEISNLDELRRDKITEEIEKEIAENPDPQEKSMRQELLKERTDLHQEVVKSLAKLYLERKIRPKRDDFDLFVEKNGRAILHEIKTIGPEDRRDERLQIINAVGKLLYYEHFNIPGTLERSGSPVEKFVVFDREPLDQDHVAFLRSIGLHVLWVGRGDLIEGHPESVAELHRFLGIHTVNAS